MSLPDEFHEIAERVNNWGRWGADDEIGTLNLVTGEVVREAARCVRSGRRVPLALPLKQDGVQTGVIPGRLNPLHVMVQLNQELFGPGTVACSDDAVTMGLQAGTHWDALPHVSHSGRLYNGRPAAGVTAHGGAAFSGIDKARHLVSRGVLLDVARARGVDRLEGGHAVTPEDLDAAEELAGTRVRAGDVVLVRTGQMRVYLAGDAHGYAYPSP
ncbi:cyclase family protein, partial [Streptomyces anandii]|uniref:cyclase family protein n=1 Tax=Streptomyces anandii TaxID=285454 RepID=UPI001E3177C5